MLEEKNKEIVQNELWNREWKKMINGGIYYIRVKILKEKKLKINSFFNVKGVLINFET